MVCVNPPNNHDDASDDHGLTPEDIARLHQIRREAVANERDLREAMATTGLSTGVATELTNRLTAIKAVASAFLDGGEPPTQMG